MSPDELIERIATRIAQPLGRSFAKATLRDLVKDGLVREAVRDGNDGVRPRYSYDWRDYHRVALIVMLQARGLTSRDALRLRLFFLGIPLPIYEVRHALNSEFRKAAAKINNQIRTGYLDNQKRITPKRLQSIMREIGELDPALKSMGAQISPDILVELIRGARQESTKEPLNSTELNLDLALSGKPEMDKIALALAPMLSGMFLLDNGAGDTQRDCMDGILASATESDLNFARSFAWRGKNLALSLPAMFGLDADASPDAGPKIRRTLRFSREYIALQMAIGLRLSMMLPQLELAPPPKFVQWFSTHPEYRGRAIEAKSDAERFALMRAAYSEFAKLGDSQS